MANDRKQGKTPNQPKPDELLLLKQHCRVLKKAKQMASAHPRPSLSGRQVHRPLKSFKNTVKSKKDGQDTLIIINIA